MHKLKSGLTGRRVLIAGSASKHGEVELLHYAHQLVRLLVMHILQNAGGLVLGVGKEPPYDESPNSPSLIFDWTALDTALEFLSNHNIDWPEVSGPPIVVITSEKAVSEIPENRRALWLKLRQSGYVNVEYILPGARSGAMLRDRQTRLSDILMILGGGTGVEHLSDLMREKRFPVIPFDLPLGSSRDDGTGGAVRLSGEAKSNVNRFFRLQKPFDATSGANYALLTTSGGKEDVRVVAQNSLNLVERLSLPTAFYTRLMDRENPSFLNVENFFRTVVDVVVEEAGYCRHEVGTDTSLQPFINTAIFENLHYSSVVMVDLTANRNNCYMELGYALGHGMKVIMMAEQGTSLPFDPKAIPCHFWRHGVDDTERLEELRVFWRTNIDRHSLVS